MQTRVNDGGLGAIDAAARQYADALARLEGAMSELDVEVRALKRKLLPRIRRLAEVAANAKGALAGELEARPDLFVRPRSLVLHGIKVGWQKAPDQLVIDDAERTAALIRKHLPDQADALLKVVETPIKDAVRELAHRDLARICVRIIAGADKPFIKSAAGEVEKIVDALLREEVGG